MASARTLELLEAARKMVLYFEAIVAEETAVEENLREDDASRQAEPEQSQVVSDAAEIVVEAEEVTARTTTKNSEPISNEGANTEAVEEITVVASDHVAIVTTQSSLSKGKEASALTAATIAELRSATAGVIARGDFREMGNHRRMLQRYCLRAEAEQVTAEFTRRNRLQAEGLLAACDQLLVGLEEACQIQDVSRVRNVLANQVPGVFARLNYGLKPHVKVQIEGIEGMTIGKIRASFDERIEEAVVYLAALEQEAWEAAERREQEIAAALAGNVCPEDTQRVRMLVSQIEANRRTGNIGAIRAALGKLRRPENFLAGIAHFESVPKFQGFVTEVESATRIADSAKRQQKKGGKRHRQSA